TATLCVSTLRPHPISTLFPYTTLFRSERTLASHRNNRTKLSSRHRHDGEARLAHKLNFLQPGSSLDLLKRDWSPQRFDRCKVHSVPVAFFGGWIGISSSRNFGDADDGFVFSAMIEEDFVAFFHPAQIIPRRVV